MYRKATALLGAGVLAVGLTAPFAAMAHADDNALAFVIGAAVGQALDRDDVRYVHVGRGHGRYHHPVFRSVHYGDRWGDRWDRRFDRRHDRWERRDDRWDRRHDRRHHRDDDCRDRHDRRHRG